MDLSLRANLKLVQFSYPAELSGVLLGVDFSKPEAKDEAGLSAEGGKPKAKTDPNRMIIYTITQVQLSDFE